MKNLDILQILVYLHTHNKNYTKEQYFLIDDLYQEFTRKCEKARQRELKKRGAK